MQGPHLVPVYREAIIPNLNRTYHLQHASNGADHHQSSQLARATRGLPE